jgi:two-component system sensor histidine kinase BaeS
VRIQSKLFVVFAIVNCLTVAFTVVLMQWNVDRGLLDYVNTRELQNWQDSAEPLASYFDEHGSWEKLRGDHRALHALLGIDKPDNRGPRGKRPGPDKDQGRRRPPPDKDHAGRPLERGFSSDRPGTFSPPEIALLDASGAEVVAASPARDRYLEVAIVLNEDTVGWLLVPAHDQITDGFELNFLEQQRETLLIISLLVICLTTAASLPLARQLVVPVKELAGKTRLLAQGSYDQQCDESRGDEFSDLARDFNQLSQTLNDADVARKRWLADTSHELRTPLAIVQGELEAMLDGVRETTPEAIRSVHQEVLRLGRLVEDLRQLSSADVGAMQYRMDKVDLATLCEELVAQYREKMSQCGLSLSGQIDNTIGLVWGDESRLVQLLGNVLANNEKYSAAGGEVLVTLQESKGQAMLSIEDSAPGVSDAALGKLFDYLYRTDDSRSRETGGTGLGLAIGARIATAHGGTLGASHSELGGLAVTLTLPLLA